MSSEGGQPMLGMSMRGAPRGVPNPRAPVERMPIDGRRARHAAEQTMDASTASYALWIGLGALAAVLAGRLRSAARSRGRKVSEVMIDEVVTIPPTATLREASERMREA